MVKTALVLGGWLAATVLLRPCMAAERVLGQVLQRGGLADIYPAAHAMVSLAPPEGPRIGPASALHDGRFVFHDVAPGEYRLEAWPLGYGTGIPITREVTVTEQVEVTLEPIVVPYIR